MTQFQKQLAGYRMTTAEIVYRMPDHPSLLQSFIWQKLDLAPEYPILKKFLNFWTEQIEGKIHSVRIAQKGLVSPIEWKAVKDAGRLH